jgi:hypothetical protein
MEMAVQVVQWIGPKCADPSTKHVLWMMRKCPNAVHAFLVSNQWPANAFVRFPFVSIFLQFLAVNSLGNCADPIKNDCHQYADCIDIPPGKHFCSCQPGFIGDGMRCDGKCQCRQ